MSRKRKKRTEPTIRSDRRCTNKVITRVKRANEQFDVFFYAFIQDMIIICYMCILIKNEIHSNNNVITTLHNRFNINT
jgi:hypothetical protein